MAQRWLRGPYPQLSGTNYQQSSRGFMILVYFWFRYLLEYTVIEDNVAGAFSFTGCEDDSGTDGQLTAVNYRFSSSSASFTSGDVGKFLVILDSTNDVNCGIYKIANYVDGNNVDIDFYSPDYPTAATGLSWWLVDSASGTALDVGDNFVCAVNHSTSPWQVKVEITQYFGSGFSNVDFQVAGELGSWNTSTHDWNSGSKVLYRSYSPDYGPAVCCGRGYIGGDTAARIYAYGDTDGNIMAMMTHLFGGTGNKNYVFLGVYDTMFETAPAREAAEKVFAFGQAASNNGADGARNGNSTLGFDLGYGWNANLRDGQYPVRWCGFWDDTMDYFTRSHTAPNHRNGAEYDGLGIWTVIDADVSYDPVWALLGQMPKDHVWLGAVAGIGELTTFGGDQYMHLEEGLCIPWPGIRWQ